MVKRQYGGLEPLKKTPDFKYTFNEERKLFISSLYPYADYFLRTITKIPFHNYSFKGECEYRNEETENVGIINSSSSGHPIYFFSGGAVYEILNSKYKHVIDLHKYSDATGDMDVGVYPPNLTVDDEYRDVYCLDSNGKINAFYEHFTSWIYDHLLDNIKHIKTPISKIYGLVDFDIDDYEEIPSNHKTADLGFMSEKVGKLYVVGFINEDITMYKIQVVCKVESDDLSVIDHVIELIIPLPEGDSEFIASNDSYSQPIYDTVSVNNIKFNIQKYNSLITDNIEAYLERKASIGASNQNNVIHKAINHISRLFYLYELFYLNPTTFELGRLNTLFLYGLKKSQITQLSFLYYYKIVDDMFHLIKVDTKFFLNAYSDIVKKNTYLIKTFNVANPNYFVGGSFHDVFIDELFNDSLFESTDGLLTFPSPINSTTTGGRRRRKTRRHRRGKNFSKKRV
jgi:hypothetical protein